MTECIADRILQYLLQCFDTYKDDYYVNETLKKICYDHYKMVRGDIILNGLSPKCVAAAIFYISCVYNGTPFTQETVATMLSVSTTSLIKYFKIFKKYYNY